MSQAQDVPRQILTLIHRFLWAVCQIEHLSRIRTAITKDVLTTLPQGLENTFEGILSRLEEEDQSLALDILRVISFSERTLDVAEVVEAVAVTDNIWNLQQLRNRALRRPNDVFQLCGSLIRKSPTTGKISLSHFSVKEFLSRPVLGRGRRNLFYLESVSSQKAQLKMCILYLSMEDFRTEKFRGTLRLALDPLYTDTDFQIMDSFPLLDYASNFWVPHLKKLSPEGFQAMWPFLNNFLDSKQGSFESWVLISQYSHGDYKFPLGSTAIHIAALYGLEALIVKLLKEGPASRSQTTSDGRTCLHIALENQQEDIIDLLLNSHKREDPLINKLLISKDGRGRTPLHTAIESGNENAVVRLVTAGADVNVVQSGRTPISVAVENQWDLLSDFLSQKADPMQKLSDGRTLLHIAAESGSVAWATALLKFHRDQLLNALDENEWTPLHFAMDREHLDVARVLVDSNCLIEVYDANGWTPLHATIRRRNLACASFLLTRDWHVNPQPTIRSYQGRPSRSDPSTASTRRRAGNRQSRQSGPSSSLHSKYRSDRPRGRFYDSYSMDSSDPEFINLPSRPKRRQPSPLDLAVKESYAEGVELLAQHLDKLMRLGMDDSEKVMCLNMAIELSSIRIVLVLMKMAAKWTLERALRSLVALSSDAINDYLKDIFTSREIYDDILPRMFIAARKEGIPSIIRVWSDPEEDVIQTAIEECPGLAKTFMENGIAPAKILAEGTKNSQLHRAIARWELNLARSLVELGADPEVRNANNETPLLALSSLDTSNLSYQQQQEYLPLMQALVSKGADVHAVDGRLRGICHRAASAGNEKLLKWSLQTLNLDAISRDQNSRTPLLLAVESGRTGSVYFLLKHIRVAEEGRDGCERVIDAMEYANMRSAPLLRAMVERVERKIAIVNALVEADERAFQQLSPARQADLRELRTAFYFEALTWTIDCCFFEGFQYLFTRVPQSAFSIRRNLDGDSIYHVAAASRSDEYLKTLLQVYISWPDSNDNTFSSPNIKNESPLDIVIRDGSEQKLSLLLLHGATLTGAQIAKAKEKGMEQISYLMY